MSSIHIDAQAYAGTSIDQACKDAVALAERLAVGVWFEFKGVRCLATGDTDPACLEKEWWSSRATGQSHISARNTRKVYVPAVCQGANCGATDGVSHSPKCIVEAAEAQGWSNAPEAIDARYQVMVNRFLGWKLPKDFAPDAGISFKPTKPYDEPGWWPVGTNLFHAGQALEMFKHCVELPGVEEPVSPEANRAEFEAWVKSVPFFALWDVEGSLERDEHDGGYLDANAQAAWLAWNARGAK